MRGIGSDRCARLILIFGKNLTNQLRKINFSGLFKPQSALGGFILIKMD